MTFFLQKRHLLVSFVACFGLILGVAVRGSADDTRWDVTTQAETVASTDLEPGLPFFAVEPWVHHDSHGTIRQTMFQDQPAPLQTDRITAPTMSSPAASQSLSSQLFGSGGQNSSLLAEARSRRAQKPGTSVVLGSEARVRATSDVGNLLFKSDNGIGIGSQRRTPIITDTRVRGKSLGRLIASGSYWAPARDDLDTILSKIDSRIVEDVIVVKGPYSVLYGPGHSFIDFKLKEAPRYNNGPEIHGSTSLEYQSQGEALYGRQVIEGGDAHSGFRIGYGHRTATDYEAGNGMAIPSGYKSRNFDVAFGFDLTKNSRVEFNYLRLDQTDMELPGAFFDLDLLVTDGYEASYILENQENFDSFRLDTWRNQTRFNGSYSSPAKKASFPLLTALGITDDSTDGRQTSTGYSAAMTWNVDDGAKVTAGTDLRYLTQNINERATFTNPGVFTLTDIWAGVPQAHAANPGVFINLEAPVDDDLRIETGARLDFYSANIEKPPTGQTFSFPQAPVSYDTVATFLGTSEFDRDIDPMWGLFATAEYDIDENITFNAGGGHSMRAPTLTELYAVGPFLSVLQNGLTAVAGNPLLKPSGMWQIDLGVAADYGFFRSGVSGFHSWVNNFITLEHIGSAPAPADAQRQYLFVNTPSATLVGGEVFAELDISDSLTAFGTLSYVEGRDKSRNAGGQHAFDMTTGGITEDPSLSRGISGGDSSEPLPNISPLESRVGLRWQETKDGRLGIEFAARIVDDQSRVAGSLSETRSAGFTTFDIRSVWQATDYLSFTCGVENLTNKFYREHLDLRQGRGVFQPGRNVYAGGELTY